MHGGGSRGRKNIRIERLFNGLSVSDKLECDMMVRLWKWLSGLWKVLVVVEKGKF